MPETGPSDASLFRKVCAGDKRAFDPLVERHYRLVWALAYSRLGKRDCAEDVAQEVFLVAYSNRSRLRNPGAFGAWLREITRNLCSHWRRSEEYRRRLRQELVNRRGQRSVTDTEPVALMVRQEQDAEVWEALDSLSPAVREAIVLFYVEGKSTREAARALGVSENAVRTRLYAGRTAIRENLESRIDSSLRDALPRNATRTIRLSLAAGPAVPLVGATAARGAISLWAHTFVHGNRPVVAFSKVGAALAVAALLTVGGMYTAHVANTHDEIAIDSVSAKPKADSRVRGVETNEPEVRTRSPAGAAVAESTTVAKDMPKSPDLGVVAEHGYIADPALACAVAGRVADQGGLPIADALVMVVVSGFDHDADENGSTVTWHTLHEKTVDPTHHFTAYTDESGNYVVDQIRFSGTATVWAHKYGYASNHGTVIRLHDGRALGRGTEVDETQVRGYESTLLLRRGESVKGVDINLSPGQMFEGRVVTSSGAPVADAVVRCVAGWGDPEKHISLRAGFAYTDEAGVFWFGNLEKVTHYNLYVESRTQGTTSFAHVPTGQGPVELEMKEAAQLFGVVVGADGEPASACRVVLKGFMHHQETGDFTSEYEGRTNDQGQYEIPGIDPGQDYKLAVTTLDYEYLMRPVEAAFGAGEVVEWDHGLFDQISVVGTVVGAHSGLPARDIEVHYTKVGAAPRGDLVFPNRVRTGADGSYELVVPDGRGLYRFHADYIGFPLHTKAIAAEHTRQVVLEPGADVQLDLTIPDPFTISVRLVHVDRTPEPDVWFEARQSGEGGAGWHGPQGKTDADGRYSFAGFAPGHEGWLEPRSTASVIAHSSRRYRGGPGEVFPEEEVVVYRHAGLRGVVRREDGLPLTDELLHVLVRYDGDHVHRLHSRTGADGAFEVPTGVPATRVSLVLSIRDPESERRATSGPFTAIAGEIIDLGVVVLATVANSPASE